MMVEAIEKSKSTRMIQVCGINGLFLEQIWFIDSSYLISALQAMEEKCTIKDEYRSFHNADENPCPLHMQSGYADGVRDGMKKCEEYYYSISACGVNEYRRDAAQRIQESLLSKE